jgi:hypothetical protein
LSGGLQLAPQFPYIARIERRSPQPGYFYVEEVAYRTQVARDVMTAGAILTKPIVAEVDD